MNFCTTPAFLSPHAAHTPPQATIGVQGTSSLVRPGETWSPVATGETPLLKPGVRPGFQPKHTKKERPTGWVGLSRDCAACGIFPEIARPAGRALFFLFSLIFAGRKSKEIPRSAERVSGLCPENPQPLKRLAKLSVRGAVLSLTAARPRFSGIFSGTLPGYSSPF